MVVALHGRGGNAKEFTSRWEAFAEPRPLLVAPQGPYPLLLKSKASEIGWSWFVLSNDRELWRRGDPLATDYVLGVIREVKARRDTGEVYLLGFSQGVALAYMAALQAPEQIAGVIAVAGQLPTDTVGEEALKRAAGSWRVFIAHGEQDLSVTAGESLRAKSRLTGLGFDVELHTFSGGHELPESLLREAQAWMAAGKKKAERQ